MANLSWISSNPDYINQMIRNTQVTLSNNYNDLDNIPIIKITSTTNNPQKIWELKEGLYMIDGVAQVDNSTSYEVSNLLISMTARLENGKYILSAFIPYLRGLFEYILKTNSTEYEQHQKIVLMIKDDTLTLDNETIYTPIENYHPATKKYVDDKANEIVAELDRMGVNKENLESLNKENRIRDIKLQALLSETSDRNITIEENVRYFDMPLSIDNGIVTINEIVGETLVNVCDQEESVAITKSYTVENENHIALQGEYDGSCRPVVYGNTLVNHNADWDDSLQTGIVTNASGIEDVQVEGTKGQEVSVVVEGNTVLNHALGKTSAVVSSIEDNLVDSYFTLYNNKLPQLSEIATLDGTNNDAYTPTGRIKMLQTNTNLVYGEVYTLIVDVLSLPENTRLHWYILFTDDTYQYSGTSNAAGTIGKYIKNITISEENKEKTFKRFALYIPSLDEGIATIQNPILLEGDHITNPKYVNSNEGNYVDLTVANDMSSVVEIEGSTMVNLVNHKLYGAQHLRAVSYDEVNKEYSMTIDNYTFPAFAIKLNYSTTLNKTYFISFKMKATATKNFKYNITHFDVYSAWNVGGEEYTLTENYQTFTKTFTSTADEYLGLGFSFLRNDNNEFSDIVINIKDIMIFEGDLTQTPHLIPSGYVEGLKSSYECEVTEDGKYKVDVKVTGENLCPNGSQAVNVNIDTGSEYYGASNCRMSDYVHFDSSVSYSYKVRINKGTPLTSGVSARYYDINKKYIGGGEVGNNVPLNAHYIRCRYLNENLTESDVVDFMITKEYHADWVEYFESTKTFYLNSPLLEGDKIVTKNGKVYHYHKMGKVVFDGSENWTKSSTQGTTTCRFYTYINNIKLLNNNYESGVIKYSDKFRTDISCEKSGLDNIEAVSSTRDSYICINIKSIDNTDGFKQWLQANPTTVVYELASPYYELIDEYNNTILNIPKNVAHLTHTSAVPVNNTVFTNYKDELNVLEANTQYRVMFDCDTANVPFTVTLGSTSQEVTSKKGTHSLLITTPSELVDKNLVIDGIGRCGIDNIRIFKGDVEYDYVKGLWSGYEERRLNNIYKPMQYWTYVYPSNTIQIEHEHSQHIKVTPLTNTVTSFYVSAGYVHQCLSDLKPCTVYTFIADKCVGFRNIGLMQGNTSQSISINCTKLKKGVCKFETVYFDGFTNQLIYMIPEYNTDGTITNQVWELGNILILEGDWTDNPPTYEEVMANEGKYAVKVKLDTNATIFGKGGRL